MKRVALFARNGLARADAAPTLNRVVEALASRGIEVVGDEMSRSLSARSLRDVAVRESVDGAIVLGGDGTLLRAVHTLEGGDAPILGVNFGSLGFLTEITVAELDDAIADLIAGRAAYSSRRLLRATVTPRAGAPPEWTDGLNDVTLTNASSSARILEFEVRVDGSFVSTFRADGLIVSSPTGSTAYNLAAGGPIVHPDLDALLVTPICPHMLTNRPVVVPGSSRVEVSLGDTEDSVHVSVDGQWSRAVPARGSFVVTTSPRRLRLVTSKKRDYFEVLRAKLNWGDGRKKTDEL
jgi:NAD+ kinase